MSIIFDKVRWVNFLATGNAGNEILLNESRSTLISATNGCGKCCDINTIVRLQNKKTGEIIETTIGDLYAQTKQKHSRKD